MFILKTKITIKKTFWWKYEKNNCNISISFFVSVDTSLQIKKQVTFNSFYGNINSIKRASDGEYYLVIDNQYTDKKTGLVVIKTKGLGKDANSVNSSNIPPINSNYIFNNLLKIDINEGLNVNARLDIYNMLGQKVISTTNLQKYLDNKSLYVDVSTPNMFLSDSSIYFYILNNNNIVHTGKFMIK